jgi:hypothetical protein
LHVFSTIEFALPAGILAAFRFERDKVVPGRCRLPPLAPRQPKIAADEKCLPSFGALYPADTQSPQCRKLSLEWRERFLEIARLAPAPTWRTRSPGFNSSEEIGP